MRVQDSAAPLSEHERARAERKMRLLIHGPQLAGQGIEQAQVDTLFADGRSEENSQSDIDELFA
jgi:hypothetical protein